MSKPPKITGARFVKGAARAAQFPDWPLPEVAFGGRSNVGKSSLLRTLVGSRRLVRVSRTPGRTQEVNFFQLAVDGIGCAFVDLPGYGYAKVPGSLKHRWGKVVEAYFAQRAQLAGLVLLVDARRTPDDQERDLIDFMARLDRPCVTVFTKIDKLPKTKRADAMWRACKLLGLQGKPIGFSALSGEGTADVLARVKRLVVAQAERINGLPLRIDVPDPDAGTRSETGPGDDDGTGAGPDR